MVTVYTTRGGLARTGRRLLGGTTQRVQVAALPWRKGPDGVEVMLVTSRDTGRWVLPKGWPEKSEAFCDAAAREAAEEAGITGAIDRIEVGRYFYEKQLPSGTEKRCEVRVFPMEIDMVRDKWPERKQRTRSWFSAAEAATKVHEPDLADLIERFSRNPRSVPVLP